MIRFRPKNQEEINLVDEAIDYLKSNKLQYKVIKSSDRDRAAGLNTKQMVLTSIKETTQGSFQITLMDKNSVVNGKVYPYTEKLLGTILGLRIIKSDESTSTITAESDYKGKLLDVVDILARRYQVSIIK